MARVILIAATSLDGRITRGKEEGNAFVSEADRRWFQETLSTMDAVLMGRKTYEAVADKLHRRSNATTAPRIVFTRHPTEYSKHTGPGLQFTNESPRACIQRLDTEGKTRVALVGGAELHTAFFDADLVDEVWLTLAPNIFGEGKLLAPGAKAVNLQLTEHAFLSSQTLLLKYRVETSS